MFFFGLGLRRFIRFVREHQRRRINQLNFLNAMLSETIHFEGFELDPSSFELRQDGRLVKLERIPLQLLFLLTEIASVS